MTMTPEDKFWSRVGKTEDDSCWLWLGSRKELNGGYGQLSFHGKFAYAHRVSWQLSNGPIPPGKFVLHKCDNPPCVRPDHLFIGTPADNMADMYRKGRQHTPPNLSGVEQYHFRTEDTDLIDAIAFEQTRLGLKSRSKVLEALLRAGVEQMRWRREQEAIMVYKSAQEVEQEEGIG